MKYLNTYNLFEYNTEYDDHKVGPNVNINTDKKTGQQLTLPLDYFIEPDEDGDIDDEEYYSLF